MDNKLMEEITKILILSRYEESHVLGNTAQEIQNFENRAIDAYLGKNDDPSKIIFNIFHAKVDRDASLIFGVMERHPNQPLQPTTKSSGDTNAVHSG